jgi:hypothetical protein
MCMQLRSRLEYARYTEHGSYVLLSFYYRYYYYHFHHHYNYHHYQSLARLGGRSVRMNSGLPATRNFFDTVSIVKPAYNGTGLNFYPRCGRVPLSTGT